MRAKTTLAISAVTLFVIVRVIQRETGLTTRQLTQSATSSLRTVSDAQSLKIGGRDMWVRCTRCMEWKGLSAERLCPECKITDHIDDFWKGYETWVDAGQPVIPDLDD